MASRPDGGGIQDVADFVINASPGELVDVLSLRGKVEQRTLKNGIRKITIKLPDKLDRKPAYQPQRRRPDMTGIKDYGLA